MKRQPTVEWQVAGLCNYACSYCIQSPKHRIGHPSDPEIDRLLDFFAGLDGKWEIKMTGGEPFAFRGFLDRIVPGLIERTGHTVSVLTNLSAPLAVLERFARLTRGRLGIVSASLHLEHVELADFVDKARWLRDRLDSDARLVVNSVLVPGRLAQVEQAREVLEPEGITLFPQLMKTKAGVADYSEPERPALARLLGPSPSSHTANLAPSHRGRLCWAGAEYFVLTQRGDVWSCRTAKRFDRGYLGNVLEGTARLRVGPERCPWDICPCTVPANRGMIEGVSSRAPRVTPARPAAPEEGVMLWNVATACNYRCSYCSQRDKDDRGRLARDVPAFLAAFARLPGRFEVKLSGGEPFAHPELEPIVDGLARLGHRISIVTNLSASQERLLGLVRAARGRVATLSASLHLEYVEDVAAFVGKAAWLRDELSAARAPDVPRPDVCVTTVATRQALPRLSRLAELFRAEGLAFKLQPERQHGALVEYSPVESAQLTALGGHNATGALAHDFFGQPCWAGARFLVMDDRGDAYRCYPARRAVLAARDGRVGRIPDPERERRLGRLGSFLDPSFALEPGPARCLFHHCYCTVPIARGMMSRSDVGASPRPTQLEVTSP